MGHFEKSTNLIWYIVLMIRKLLKSHKVWKKKQQKKQPENKAKTIFFGYFQLSQGFANLRTPKVNPFLQSFWGVNQLYTTGGSPDMENHPILSLEDPPVSPPPKKCIFRALLVVWEVYISQNTHDKSSFVVILRAQPTFYQQQFAR